MPIYNFFPSLIDREDMMDNLGGLGLQVSNVKCLLIPAFIVGDSLLTPANVEKLFVLISLNYLTWFSSVYNCVECFTLHCFILCNKSMTKFPTKFTQLSCLVNSVTIHIQ